MSRILAIKAADGEREVDYSLLSVKEIQKRIKSYEKKFGSFAKFFRSYDCESSLPDDYVILIDWECLINELKNRKDPHLTLVKTGKKRPR